MSDLKSNVMLKVLIIFVLILILLIPTIMVESLIHERESISKSAIEEVSSKWGKGQTVTGPYVSIPSNVYVIEHLKEGKTTKKFVRTEWNYILPDELSITGNINPEKRYRGIHEVVVFKSGLKISGIFKTPIITESNDSLTEVLYNHAILNIGITDLNGIEQQISVIWNSNEFFFNSGISTNDIVESGINTNVPINSNDTTNYNFSLDLRLMGSQYLYFIPVGKTTDVNLKSNWTTPSFTGTYLPDTRTISNDGFTANWNILHLNRNYPQSWKGDDFNINNSKFGTDLLLPVDNYKKSYRVARYAILFIILTFLVFFFVEVLNKIFINPVQYLLVGLALIIFYTLLLSMSEHIVFNYAYWVATILTLFSITGYVIAILKSKKISFLITSILLIMYTFIFVIIQLEDYALLIGSIGMFVIMSTVMFMSRKIDWYQLRIGNNNMKNGIQ